MTDVQPTPDAPIWHRAPASDTPTVKLRCGCDQYEGLPHHIATVTADLNTDTGAWKAAWNHDHAAEHAVRGQLAHFPQPYGTLQAALDAVADAYRPARQALVRAQRDAQHRQQEATRRRDARRQAYEAEIDALSTNPATNP